jgi:hypothetical protein
MRTCRPGLLVLATLLGVAPAAHAHVGDQIYPFFELLDDDLDRIDLTDGSVDDWLEVIGEPSLTASDFLWLNPYDPSELDFRIWLAWHSGSSTLWIAMERFDDLYFNLYDGDKNEHLLPGEKPFLAQYWDGGFGFGVDGDHSGGRYWFSLANCDECTVEESMLLNNRHAQEWLAITEAPDGEHLFHVGASEWVARDPYAAAGGGVIGESPALTVTEIKVTPFDDLIYNDEDASEASQFYPGKTIGFSISTYDIDNPRSKDVGRSWLGGASHADFFVDGLLIGAGEDPSLYDDVSAVEPSSWARIKASF